jgi:transmembrane sensor
MARRRTRGQDGQPSGPALDAAAEWFARLNGASISTVALHEFQEWRAVPENDAAYREVEGLWRHGAKLKGDADIRAAVAQARNRRRRRTPAGGRRWPGFALDLAAVGAVSIGAVVLVWTLLARPAGVYQTAVGEVRTVQLADGSRIRLDTATRLSVRFTAKARDVALLSGQAFFDVAHQPSRPFVVSADGAQVRAVGTRFDVRRSDGQVHVTLVQGVVRVRADTPTGALAWTLHPGQQMTAGSVIRPPAPADVAAAVGWTDGRLVFHDLPLAEAVAEVNRYSRRPIVLGPGAPAAVAVNGVFDSANTDGFVAAVTSLYDLKASRRSDGALVLAAAGSAAGQKK